VVKERQSRASEHQKYRGEFYFENCYRNAPSPWFCDIKMNPCTFVSINRMKAGMFVKASVNIVSPGRIANVVKGCRVRNIFSGILR
jgi:hypothetical protein